MRNFGILGLLFMFLLTGCAAQNGWTPTVDLGTGPYGYGQAYPAPQPTPPPAPRPRRTMRRPSTQTAAPGYPQRDYTKDLTECKMLAQRVSGFTPNQAITGGLVGGALGAAAGAAIGAAVGHPGKGAAIGAAAGGIGGGTYNAAQAEAKYKRAYINCMRQRGWNVIN